MRVFLRFCRLRCRPRAIRQANRRDTSTRLFCRAGQALVDRGKPPRLPKLGQHSVDGLDHIRLLVGPQTGLGPSRPMGPALACVRPRCVRTHVWPLPWGHVSDPPGRPDTCPVNGKPRLSRWSPHPAGKAVRAVSVSPGREDGRRVAMEGVLSGTAATILFRLRPGRPPLPFSLARPGRRGDGQDGIGGSQPSESAPTIISIRWRCLAVLSRPTRMCLSRSTWRCSTKGYVRLRAVFGGRDAP